MAPGLRMVDRLALSEEEPEPEELAVQTVQGRWSLGSQDKAAEANYKQQ